MIWPGTARSGIPYRLLLEASDQDFRHLRTVFRNLKRLNLPITVHTRHEQNMLPDTSKLRLAAGPEKVAVLLLEISSLERLQLYHNKCPFADVVPMDLDTILKPLSKIGWPLQRFWLGWVVIDQPKALIHFLKAYSATLKEVLLMQVMAHGLVWQDFLKDMRQNDVRVKKQFKLLISLETTNSRQPFDDVLVSGVTEYLNHTGPLPKVHSLEEWHQECSGQSQSLSKSSIKPPDLWRPTPEDGAMKVAECRDRLKNVLSPVNLPLRPND